MYFSHWFSKQPTGQQLEKKRLGGRAGLGDYGADRGRATRQTQRKQDM